MGKHLLMGLIGFGEGYRLNSCSVRAAYICQINDVMYLFSISCSSKYNHVGGQ